MSLEAKVFDFQEIVPRRTWAERHLPTFIGLARKAGYAQRDETKTEYPTAMKVRMPEIPSGIGESHPLLYFFERVKEVADRIQLQGERRLAFLLDERSYERVMDFPSYGDGTMMGEAMYHTMALLDYGREWFTPRGYQVTSAEIGDRNTLSLKLQKV